MADVARQESADCLLKVGDEAARKLAAALKLAGFTLPTLAGDFPCSGGALVSLGRAPVELVIRLAEWIEERA